MSNLQAKKSAKSAQVSKGTVTRRKILAHAMQIAAKEGLAGLTIGRLAQDLGMSKSGLFAHFRSKRSLEMDTIHEARKLFNQQVLYPASLANEGIDQLWVLCESWLAHIQRKVFPGGYFFTGAFFECAERSGAIEEQFSLMAREWWQTLNRSVQKAQQLKEINSSADAPRINFDLNGILLATYWTYLVEKDNKVFSEAKAAIVAKLKELATDRIPSIAFKTDNAWNDYLKAKRTNKPKSIFAALGKNIKVQSGNPSPPTPPPMNHSQPNQPPKRLKNPFYYLGKAVRGKSSPP
jgi:AcrR family transcriptional regulator